MNIVFPQEAPKYEVPRPLATTPPPHGASRSETYNCPILFFIVTLTKGVVPRRKVPRVTSVVLKLGLVTSPPWPQLHSQESSIDHMSTPIGEDRRWHRGWQIQPAPQGVGAVLFPKARGAGQTHCASPPSLPSVRVYLLSPWKHLPNVPPTWQGRWLTLQRYYVPPTCAFLNDWWHVNFTSIKKTFFKMFLLKWRDYAIYN